MRVELDNHMNTKGLRGAQIEILPYIRVFPPGPYRRKSFIIHFGWLYWSLMIFF